tara:strand:- start:17 stop:226 length:210 start_codon:yes stop_codon:yes gene_type:complete
MIKYLYSYESKGLNLKTTKLLELINTVNRYENIAEDKKLKLNKHRCQNYFQLRILHPTEYMRRLTRRRI